MTIIPCKEWRGLTVPCQVLTADTNAGIVSAWCRDALSWRLDTYPQVKPGQLRAHACIHNGVDRHGIDLGGGGQPKQVTVILQWYNPPATIPL